jgi:hypothetical protein
MHATWRRCGGLAEIHRGSGASAAETTPLNTEREALAERVSVVQNVLPSCLLTTLPDKPAKWPACEVRRIGIGEWPRRTGPSGRDIPRYRVSSRAYGFGDLISYQNDGKGPYSDRRQGRENMSEYSISYIDMRADKVLISAE